MPAARAPGKSQAAFRTISEVSEDLDVPQHVLRFWETKFSQVKPLKRGGGRRYYRPEDVDLLRRIRELLYTDGYTIKGVQKLLRESHGKLDLDSDGPPPAEDSKNPVLEGAGESASGRRPSGDDVDKVALQGILTELVELRDLLRSVTR